MKESVGVYLDETPISMALFTPDLDLFDLQRVEVLRGPQGTLFGAGSIDRNGALHHAQPQLGEFEGAAEVSCTDGQGADKGGGIKGMLNAPLGDRAALRIAAYYDENRGLHRRGAARPQSQGRRQQRDERVARASRC